MYRIEVTRRVYCYVRHFIDTHEIAPTHREIAQACHISKGSVSFHLERLMMLGHVEITPRKTRGITLISDARRRIDCGS